MSRHKNRNPRPVVAIVASAALLMSVAAYANEACLLTPQQLQTLTGRTFAEGQASRNPGDGSPLCHYAEQTNPQRKLTIGVSSTNAKQQFDSRLRMLQMGGKSIELEGVGDRAYYNGTAAGVLAGSKLIAISNLRRASDPKIESDKVIAALRAALQKQ
ncbi:hypothetical protein [Povalibacter sp.]|uniref:hypothetical protein n=1 Tax=Povalibacter sp. TaxID=1962978 RepID=UPI002F3E48FD